MSRPLPLRPVLALVFCLSGLLLASCATEPVTGRRTLSLVSEGQANQMGLQAYDQILAESQLSKDVAANRMVRNVGERIARIVDARMKEGGREPFEWQFNVIAEPTVNAFCLPGGKVAFYEGILPICETETGIAVVMGHEVAHAWQNHGAKRVSEQMLAKGVMTAAALVLGGGEGGEGGALSNGTLAALGLGTQLGGLAFGRKDESAADHAGLMIMAEAGYDPREAVAFWSRMAEMTGGGGGQPEFLSTHPGHETRIQDLQKLMPEALAIYEKSAKAGR